MSELHRVASEIYRQELSFLKELKKKLLLLSRYQKSPSLRVLYKLFFDSYLSALTALESLQNSLKEDSPLKMFHAFSELPSVIFRQKLRTYREKITWPEPLSKEQQLFLALFLMYENFQPEKIEKYQSNNFQLFISFASGVFFADVIKDFVFPKPRYNTPKK